MRFEVSADDLLNTRFALSPSFELENLLRKLAEIDRSFPYVERFRPAYAGLSLSPLIALIAPGYGPTFVAPPPQGMSQSIEDDLAMMRATPLETARAEIAESLRRKPCKDPDVLRVLESRDVVARLADTLEQAWHTLLAPEWPQLRAICERDVVQRSAQLSRAGWSGALAGLHQRVSWRDGGIEISQRPGREVILLGGKGLLLVPSVFIWPQMATHQDDPWPKALIYPARGIAALWETETEAPEALAQLIGRSRARLLVALAEPASTTQLAQVCRLAVGAVNDHLQVLLRAGLLERGRAGRSVLYRRTAFGDELVSRLRGPAPSPTAARRPRQR